MDYLNYGIAGLALYFMYKILRTTIKKLDSLERTIEKLERTIEHHNSLLKLLIDIIQKNERRKE